MEQLKQVFQLKMIELVLGKLLAELLCCVPRPLAQT